VAIPVLLVGTFHLANPGRDLANVDVDDVLTERRQQELEVVAAALSRFAPTKVAVEYPADCARNLDAAYAAWRDGGRELNRSEVEQLGFRVAARGNHDAVFGVDVEGDFYDPAIEPLIADGPNADRWARILQAAEAATAELTLQLARSSIGDVLRMMNSPDAIAAGLEPYGDLLAISEGGNLVGVTMVANWYTRNMKIAANLHAIADPGDRILVIYGHGHIPVLRHFLEAGSVFEVVDPLEFL
jgi:hypothetical protein